MEREQKQNVLFIPKWYPNREDSMLGLFVKRHAIAVSKYINTTVLAIIPSNKIIQKYEVETSHENGITEILIYVKKFKSPIGFINTLFNGLRYLNAHIAGWTIIEQTNNKPDIVHVHVLTSPGLIALYFKLRYGIPFFITEHWSRYLPHHGGFKGAFLKSFTKKVVEKSEGITTVSDALKDGMNQMGINHSNWKIIPNVIDIKRFQKLTNTKPQHFRFSHISSFEEQSKNISGILRAMKSLKQQDYQFEMVMIGDGPDWEETKKYARELGLENHIRFTGILEDDDLTHEMGLCQCSVIFSNYETFSIVIPENLSMGIPVIATAVGGIPEILPNSYGLLIPPKDEEALAKAMVSMMAQQHIYDKEEMRNYVEEHFSFDKVGHQFFEMYSKVI